MATAWTKWAIERWPTLTDSDVSALLWRCTGFPLGTCDEVEREFTAIMQAAGGDAVRALEQAAERVEGAKA